ncbi:MAG: DNA methyltransferase [Nitrososphaeraceae archaeon]
MAFDQSKSSGDDNTMNDVSHKATDFSTDSQEPEFNNGSGVNWSSILASSQPLPSNGILTTLSIDGIKIDPEYEQMAPQMSEKEFQALKESIKQQHGLYLPIVVNNNNILLDGHHRLKACSELEIKEVLVLVLSFNDKLQEKLFICESAGKRRHLDVISKAELALKTEKLLKEIANQNRLANLKQYQNQNDNSNSNYQSPTRSNELVGDVAKAAAKSAGLSPATYKRARTILEKGTEEQKCKLKSGKSSVNKEYNIIRRKEKREELIKSAQNLESPLQSDKFKIILGDFITASAKIADNSVDLILTDLPYGEEHRPLYKELALLAKRTLKPGGSIICLYGDRLRREFVEYLELDAGLIENCSLHVKLQGPFSRDYEKGIIRKQKPMLWYYKGPKREKTGELIEDLIESGTSHKELHDWQQSSPEAETIISHQTVENQVVFDPMMGVGTNGIAALKLNRRFIGMEINEETYHLARVNIDRFLKSSTNPERSSQS